MANTDKHEWVLYDTDLTTKLGFLPTKNSDLYIEFCEPGSGSLNIPLSTNIASQITSGMFCQCYYRGAARGGFFVDNIKEVNAESGEAGEKELQLSGRGALALLDEAIIWNDEETTTTRTFNATTRASVLINLIQEAQARGSLTSLTWDFTASADSDAVSWDDTDTYQLNVGTTILDVLRSFVTLGIEFKITFASGTFTLSAYKNGFGTDKSNTVFHRIGQNCETLGSEERGKPIVNSFLAKWKSGYVESKDTTSITANRRREKLLTLDSAQSGQSASTFSSAKLDTTKDPQKSISLKVYDGIAPYIFLDYEMGDWMSVDNAAQTTSYRLLGVQLSFEEDFAHVTLELNSIIHSNINDMDILLDELLVRWNSAKDSGLTEVSEWLSIGGTDGPVYDVQWDDTDELLYIAGNFTLVNGLSVNRVGVFNPADGSWTQIGDPSGMDSFPVQIIVRSASEIFALVKSTVDEVWRWNGATWTKTAYGTSINTMIYWEDGAFPDLYIGGEITTLNGAGKAPYFLFRYNSGSWSGFGLSATVYTVYDMVEDNTEGTLIVAGRSPTVLPDPAGWYGQVGIIVDSSTGAKAFDYDASRPLIYGVGVPSSQVLYHADGDGDIYKSTTDYPNSITPTNVIGTVSGSTSFYGARQIPDFIFNLADVYITGKFDTVDGVQCDSIARYSGETWYAMPDGGVKSSGANGTAYRMAFA